MTRPDANKSNTSNPNAGAAGVKAADATASPARGPKLPRAKPDFLLSAEPKPTGKPTPAKVVPATKKPASGGASTPAVGMPPAGQPSRLVLTSVADLAKTTPAPEYLVDGVLVAGQPMVVGGPPKSLKTSIVLDLAVSLGTGTPFLGRFAVPQKRRVAVFSGESGLATVNETIQRILATRGKAAAGCAASCCFALPRLNRAADRKELTAVLAGGGPRWW